MATLTVAQKLKDRKVSIEINLDQWEQIVAHLGLFSSEFLDSIERAEQEISQGKVKRLHGLRDLRKPMRAR